MILQFVLILNKEGLEDSDLAKKLQEMTTFSTMRKLLLLTFFAAGFSALAQVETPPEQAPLDTINPSAIQAINHYLESSKSTAFKGYTIQLVSGSRTAANEVKAQFWDTGIDLEPRLVFKVPNFKIHVGSYPTELEALKDLEKIQAFFPDAFVLGTQVPWYPVVHSDSTAAATDSAQVVLPEEGTEIDAPEATQEDAVNTDSINPAGTARNEDETVVKQG